MIPLFLNAKQSLPPITAFRSKAASRSQAVTGEAGIPLCRPANECCRPIAGLARILEVRLDSNHKSGGTAGHTLVLVSYGACDSKRPESPASSLKSTLRTLALSSSDLNAVRYLLRHKSLAARPRILTLTLTHELLIPI